MEQGGVTPNPFAVLVQPVNPYALSLHSPQLRINNRDIISQELNYPKS